jgi:hypothetical protein
MTIVIYYLKFPLQRLVSDDILTGKLASYGKAYKSIACVALVCKATDEIRIGFFFSQPCSKESMY